MFNDVQTCQNHIEENKLQLSTLWMEFGKLQEYTSKKISDREMVQGTPPRSVHGEENFITKVTFGKLNDVVKEMLQRMNEIFARQQELYDYNLHITDAFKRTDARLRDIEGMLSQKVDMQYIRTLEERLQRLERSEVYERNKSAINGPHMATHITPQIQKPVQENMRHSNPVTSRGNFTVDREELTLTTKLSQVPPEQGTTWRPQTVYGADTENKRINETESHISKIGLQPDRFTDKMVDSLRPKWDGQPLTFDEIMEDWELYWEQKRKIVGDNNVVKCLAFIECLPDDEKSRAKYFVQKEHIQFDALYERFREDNQGLLPRYAHKRLWEA